MSVARALRRLTPAAAVIGALLSTLRVTGAAQEPAPAGSLLRAEAAGQRELRISGSRLARYSAIGAATGAALAFGYWSVSEEGRRGGDCRPLECALPYLTLSGAVAGLFLGRELEMQRIALTPRSGDAVKYASTAAALLAPPTYLDVRDTLVVVASDSGVQLVSATATPRALARRAAGLRGIRQVAFVPARGSLAIGTATALWEAPVGTGPARRVADGAVTALGASSASLLSATGTILHLVRGDSAARDSLDLRTPVMAVVWDSLGGSWWVATDSQLVRVRESANGLDAGITLPLPAAGRRIALSATHVAVALGEAGLMAWPRASLTSAQQGGVIAPLRLAGEPRFVFDADFAGDVLYVAGGVDGLFRVAIEPTLRIIDSSRQFPFVTLVKTDGGVVWVGDRGRNELVRVR